MLKPIIYGLPGAGKSTASKIIANRLGFEYISTDEQFRIYRAIPISDDVEGVEIMRSFLERLKKNDTKIYQKILPETEKGSLSNSKLFRSFGEDVFRLYEIEMNKWLYKTGKFKNKIIDLSASALLYDENRELFSEKSGYKKFLLDVDVEIILPRLLKDYQTFKENLHTTGIRNPIRGAYEIIAETFEKNGDKAINGLRKQLNKDYKFRIEKYRQYSDEIIEVKTKTTPEQICDIILEKLSD